MKMCEKKTHSVRLAPYLYTWFLVAVSLCGAVSGLPCLLLWHTGGAVYGTLRHGAVSAHTEWGFVRRTSALAWCLVFVHLAHFGSSVLCWLVALCRTLRWRSYDG